MNGPIFHDGRFVVISAIKKNIKKKLRLISLPVSKSTDKLWLSVPVTAPSPENCPTMLFEQPGRFISDTNRSLFW